MAKCFLTLLNHWKKKNLQYLPVCCKCDSTAWDDLEWCPRLRNTEHTPTQLQPGRCCTVSKLEKNVRDTFHIETSSTNLKTIKLKNNGSTTQFSWRQFLLPSSRSVMSKLRVGRIASNILKSFPKRGMSSRRHDGAWLGHKRYSCCFTGLISP